jgi:hypothetical protein
MYIEMYTLKVTESVDEKNQPTKIRKKIKKTEVQSLSSVFGQALNISLFFRFAIPGCVTQRSPGKPIIAVLISFMSQVRR